MPLSSGASESREIGSKGAADELGEHFSCSGVIPSGLEVQSLRKGPPGILTGGSGVERAQLSRFLSHTAGRVPDLDGASWGGSVGKKLPVHLEETCGCVSRE